jgi:hypothetical protein
MSSILLTLLLAMANDGRPHAAIGSVVIERVDGETPMILIAVDAADASGRTDGAVDYLYKFYTTEPLAADRYALPLAHVDDLGGQLVVSAPPSALRFTFANQGVQPLPADYVLARGRGLACYWGSNVRRLHIRGGRIECGESALCRAE